MTAATTGARRLVAAADGAAQAEGLRPGLAVAQAQGLVPKLHVVEADPAEDEAALLGLARWAAGYSPLVAVDPPDGLWLDIAGLAHLFGDEAGLLRDLVARLRRQGIAARAAVADAPGTAWAVARFGTMRVVPPGRAVEAVASLPVAALRLDPALVETLHTLGVDRVGQLAAMPRAPMVRRFGADTALRLDRALGQAFEPIDPLMPDEIPSRRLAFAEPLGRIEDLQRVVRRLAERLCRDLARRAEGVRRLDLILRRVDGLSAALRAGTARPSRDAAHLARLFDETLPGIDPGFGIEEMCLIASRVEPLSERQTTAQGMAGEEAEVDLSRLVDRLGARLGPRNVYRVAPVESRIPERSTRRIAPLAPPAAGAWPDALARPARLVEPPEPVVATALLPDHPPAFFVWRRVRHRVAKADGPERIAGEWWRGEEASAEPRDYYRVETDRGARFWLFRDAPADRGGRWWLHGILP